MNKTSRALSIIAYYLSKYDMEAVTALGYSNRSNAIKAISVILGRNNNYLKLRRDEFDALPSSSSHRQGWNKRPPNGGVVKMAAYLEKFTFQELTEISLTLINNRHIEYLETDEGDVHLIDSLPEEVLEQTINLSDPNAKIVLRSTTKKSRVYNRKIISVLKHLYKGNCQICGSKPFDQIDADICEAHHIDYFSVSQNNDFSNIVILCPNHHRLLHLLNPTFIREENAFELPNGERLFLSLNYHI